VAAPSGLAGLVGRRGEPFEVVVETGKVREFARATRSAHLAYLDDPEPLSPVTFLVTAALWMGPEHSAWGDARPSPARVLHGGQEFTFLGAPPRAGSRLTGVQRIDRVYTKEGRRGGAMEFVELVTEYRDPAGVEVVLVRSTVIVTARPPAPGPVSRP
jgi:hypothetical protein